MNKVAHYTGFVGRCQQYGLTKQAADMLYKQAQLTKSASGPSLVGMGAGPLGAPDGIVGSALTRLLGGDEKGTTPGGALPVVGAIGGALPAGLLSTVLAQEFAAQKLSSLGRKASRIKRIAPVLGALGIALGGTAIGAGTGMGIGKGLSYLIIPSSRRNRKKD